jgi:hypothetical protein
MKIGTVVQITTTLSTAPDTGCTITITDDQGTEKVTDAAMSGSGTSYSYVYQSSTSDEPGKYIITIKATHGSYVALSQAKMQLDHLD